MTNSSINCNTAQCLIGDDKYQYFTPPQERKKVPTLADDIIWSFYNSFLHSVHHTNKMCVSHSIVSNSLQPHGLYPARLFCPWDSPGKNTGVDCCSLLQRIFLTQGLNLVLLRSRQILYHLSYREDLKFKLPGNHKRLCHPRPPLFLTILQRCQHLNLKCSNITYVLTWSFLF